MNRDVLPPPPLRSRPNVSVTWATKLLSGEHNCEWALWFQWRYQVPKEPETPQLVEWKRKHASLTAQRIEELEENDCNVQMESENWLEHYGSDSGTRLSGKPDIAIIAPDLLTYEECKTGDPWDADHVQVLMYVQLARLQGVRQRIAGIVIYPDDIQRVDMRRRVPIRDKFVEMIQSFVTGEPPRTPSFRECRYCKVRDYCPDRITRDPTEMEGPSWFDDGL